MLAAGELRTEIRNVIEAFGGGVGAPRNVGEFITRTQRLHLLYDYYLIVSDSDEGIESEKYLVEATKRCLEYFISNFEVDVLSIVCANWLQADDFDAVALPSYRAQAELLATALEQAKKFKSTALKDEIHQYCKRRFHFIPTIDPPSFRLTGTLGCVSRLESSHSTTVESGSPRRNASPCFGIKAEASSPSILLQDEHIYASGSSDWMPSRRLGQNMGIDEIVTTGLGLSFGRREQSCEADSEPKPSSSSNTDHQAQEQSPALVNDSIDQSSSVIYQNEDKPSMGKKRKKTRAPRKSTWRRPRTVSNPNKENFHHDADA